MTAIARKRNVPGYIDGNGVFRPIRSASYVGSGSSRRRAKVSDRKKYSRAKAGDLGKAKQERALEAPWDREFRLESEAKAKAKREQDRIERQIAAEAFGDNSSRKNRGKGQTLAQFIRSEGGLRRTFRHDGQKFRGKRSSWDSGEIDAFSRKESGTTGLTTSDPRRGKTIDKMWQAAREAGFDIGSSDEMLGLLDNEIHGGKKTYATSGSMTYNPAKRKRNTPSAARLAKAAISVFDNDLDLDVDARDVRRLEKAAKANPETFVKRKGSRYVVVDRNGREFGRDKQGRPLSWKTLAGAKAWLVRNGLWPKKNPDLLSMFANGAVGIASALQIKEMINRPKRKAAPKRRGKTTAKRKNPVRGAALRKPARSKGTARTNPTQASLFKPSTLNVLTIRTGDKLDAVYLHDGKTGGFGKKFKTLSAAKSFATRNKVKLVENPSPKVNGVFSRALARAKAKREYGKELRAEAAAARARSRRQKAESKAKANPVAKRKTVNPKSKIRNPKSTARRRTYEMFQGRPATKATPMQVSHHAPARLDALGDLIEIKMNGGPTYKFQRGVKLCAANGKLWIAGKRFAKPNPSAAANEINPIGEIDHVVYGTHKPHHGDHNYTHYIHKLGEESGVMPTLCVDREGFPVIRGGNYKIEARGIVD